MCIRDRVDAVVFFLIYFLCGCDNANITSYLEWGFLAIKYSFISCLIIVVVNILFYNFECRFFLKRFEEKRDRN